ncbi:MAG: sensor histidine kinase [Ferruginibacter sp.]
MKWNRFNIILIMGLVAIAGILVIQLYLLRAAIVQEDNKFRQKVQIALLDVVNNLSSLSKTPPPPVNPIKEMSEDYYVVNVNQEINAIFLEHYLKLAFTRLGLKTDFEYAIYNCETSAMVYGKYVAVDSTAKINITPEFPRQQNLVYYFAIRFPEKSQTIYGAIKLWIAFSIVMFFVLIIYAYSVVVLLQQKKYAALQKDFINNMTHEFKTPLSSILLSSKYIIKQPEIIANERLKKYTDIIIQQAIKLNVQVEQVLGIAKTSHPNFEINKTTILPGEIIEEICSQFQLQQPAVKIDIINNANNQTIIADSFHFSNVLYNIIDNAIKYGKATPHITIALNIVQQKLQITFSDDGIGIPAKYLDQIFDNFFRVPGKHRNETKGFGLGLFYVKRIITAHQWKILAESEEHKGTKIQIIIPLS